MIMHIRSLVYDATGPAIGARKNPHMINSSYTRGPMQSRFDTVSSLAAGRTLHRRQEEEPKAGSAGDA